ncbi:MAG: DmsE family decaheme c-type cytochrome [Burkholderiales bacterium]
MRFKSIIAAAGLVAAVAAFYASPALAQEKKAAPAADNGPICVTCHEKPTATIRLTAHGAANDADGSQCQACHGNAADHLKDPSKKPSNILGSKTATAAEKSEVCLTCHAGQRQLENWSIAKHRKIDVTCVNCHSIHQPQSASNNKNVKNASFAAAPYTTTQRELTYKRCIECHTEVRGDILKPSHHPIIEGKIGCENCHDPHGSMQKASLRNESINDLCLSCHTDKRGPWIHEHPPVEENCATCHMPHGSSHRALLNQKPPELCGDCHPGGHTHGIYDGRGTLPNTLPSNVRFVSSGCVNCHRQIHGSNAPSSAFGEYFIR